MFDILSYTMRLNRKKDCTPYEEVMWMIEKCFEKLSATSQKRKPDEIVNDQIKQLITKIINFIQQSSSDM